MPFAAPAGRVSYPKVSHVLISGPDDVPAVHALQERMSLVPLTHYGQGEYKPETVKLAKPARNYDGPLGFFEELGDRIVQNPPPPQDYGLMGLFKEIGLTVDHGFDADILSEPIKRGLERALQDGEAVIAAKAKSMGREVNGWQLAPVAPEYFGNDYPYRAAVGWQSMYVNDPIEAYGVEPASNWLNSLGGTSFTNLPTSGGGASTIGLTVTAEGAAGVVLAETR